MKNIVFDTNNVIHGNNVTFKCHIIMQFGDCKYLCISSTANKTFKSDSIIIKNASTHLPAIQIFL
jgi:hypothetical protein